MAVDDLLASGAAGRRRSARPCPEYRSQGRRPGGRPRQELLPEAGHGCGAALVDGTSSSAMLGSRPAPRPGHHWNRGRETRSGRRGELTCSVRNRDAEPASSIQSTAAPPTLPVRPTIGWTTRWPSRDSRTVTKRDHGCGGGFAGADPGVTGWVSESVVAGGGGGCGATVAGPTAPGVEAASGIAVATLVCSGRGAWSARLQAPRLNAAKTAKAIYFEFGNADRRFSSQRRRSETSQARPSPSRKTRNRRATTASSTLARRGCGDQKIGRRGRGGAVARVGSNAPRGRRPPSLRSTSRKLIS